VQTTSAVSDEVQATKVDILEWGSGGPEIKLVVLTGDELQAAKA
jgi:hypothetical protein